MAHTFDIRFAKSAGLAGLFEAPANRLGWKGSGQLSIDAQGISIAMKRGLLTFFSRRMRRFPASNLTEVYREGDALRLEFNTDHSREVLPVWASGSEAAAQIVKLLPTQQTVELDHPTAAKAGYRFDWRLLASLLGAALVIVAMAILVKPTTPEVAAPMLVPADELVDAVSATAPPTIAPAGALESADPRMPMKKTSASYPAARRYVDLLELELDALRADFYTLMQAPSPLSLDLLADRWSSRLQNVQASFGIPQDELATLREIQLEICVSWLDFLRNYAEGLRTHDADLTEAAFASHERADAMVKRMRWYVPD
jgi:hypothetical protein